VTDQGVDTGDLNQHVKFDNYTYIQLLSETASFDKTINRKLQQQASSFRSKKHPNSPMSLARSKSQLTHKTTVDVSTLTENRYRRDEPTPDDDITDILRRYNINGYSENIPTDTANTSLTETVSFFNTSLLTPLIPASLKQYRSLITNLRGHLNRPRPHLTSTNT